MTTVQAAPEKAPVDDSLVDITATTALTERVSPVAPPRPFNIIRIVGPIGVFGAVMAFWYGGRLLLSRNKRFLLPNPHDIILNGFLARNQKTGEFQVFRDLMKATWLDIRVAVLGLGIAIFLGVTTAIVMSFASWLEISVWPYLVALQAIPILIVAPLIGAIMGYSTSPRVFVTVVITIFPIIKNTLFGLKSVDTGFHDLFTLHGSSRLTRLFKLQLPAAAPAIFTGFGISAGLAVIGAIVGDVFFRAGEAGLGALVETYSGRLRGPETWSVIFMSAALGLAFFGFFGLLERRFVGRWNSTK